MGDTNTKTCRVIHKNDSIGVFGLGEINDRGEDFIEFCKLNNLVIANSLFTHHPRYLYTWTSPDGKIRNQIDNITVCQKWKKSIKNCKTLPDADCNSDHQLLYMVFQIKLSKIKKTPPPL